MTPLLIKTAVKQTLALKSVTGHNMLLSFSTEMRSLKCEKTFNKEELSAEI